MACSLIPGLDQVSREPDEIVLELFSEIPGQKLTVFRYPEVLEPGDTVSVFSDEDENDWASVIFSAEEETRFYFADYLDGYFYGHPVEYIFVTSDEDVLRIDGEWWPMVNGKDVFFTTQQRENMDDILVKFPTRQLPRSLLKIPRQ
jgi:hypothetical protein